MAKASYLALHFLYFRIPMLVHCDSLNVATATTILLYEAVRQRMNKGIITPPPSIHDDGNRRHNTV